MNQPMAVDVLDDDPRIDDAILQYLEAAESGTPIAEETWISLHPREIQEALRAFLANRAIVAKAADTIIPFTKDIEPFSFYRDFTFLAEGGMGTIHRCKDSRLERPIAMKVLHRRLMTIDDMPARFREEAQVAGQLQHPNIAPVHELGELADGRPYFTMKLVEGTTLSVSIREYHTNRSAERFERLLRDFVSICEGVEYAHSRGVLHRDLKPANVMVGRFGEVLVMDWGLTKVLSAPKELRNRLAIEPSIRTARGDDPEGESRPGLRGTPAFMPPEQANGSAELDARCDVFALGAILCQILTGQPAYISETHDVRELIDMACRGHISGAFLRLDASGAPRELIDLVKKCLSFQPGDRPASAKEVGDAVTRHQAKAQKRAQDAEALAQRRKWQLALASAVLLAVLGTFFGWRWVNQQRDERRDHATREVLVAMTKGQEMRDRVQKLPVATVEDNAAALAGWKEGLATVEPAVALARANDVEPATLLAVVDLHAEFEKQVQVTESRIRELQRQRNVIGKLRRAIELSSVMNLLDLRFDTAPSVAAFAEGFRELNLDLLAVEPSSAVDQLRREPEPILKAAIEGVNIWWVIDRTSRPKLSVLLDQLDDDPSRRSFRAAVDNSDPEGVKEFARASVEFARQAEFVGLVLPHLGEHEEALTLMKREVFKKPNDFGLQMTLGANQLRHAVHHRDAVGSFQAAVALSPSSSIAYENLALAHKMSGNLAESEAYFRRAFELDGQNVRALCNLSWLKLLQLDYIGMDRIAKQALEIKPGYTEALSIRAIALAYRSRTSEANELLAQIPEAERNQFYPLFAKFTVQCYSARKLEAAATARDLAARYADSEFAWFFVAFAAFVEGDTLNVERTARAALNRSTDGLFGTISRTMFVTAMILQGKLAEAEEAALKVIHELGDNSLIGQALLYEVLERQGRFVEARVIGERLKDFNPGLFGLFSKLRLAILDSRIGHERYIENIVAGRSAVPEGAAFDVAYVALYKRRPALALLMYRRSLNSTFGLLAGGARVTLSNEDEALTGWVCAARAAAMLAGGVGLDAAGATDEERRAARADALKWLKDEFKSLRPMRALPLQIPPIRRLFIYLKMCPDFAAVRDPAALAKLPEAEQKQWREFWADVDGVLAHFNSAAPKK